MKYQQLFLGIIVLVFGFTCCNHYSNIPTKNGKYITDLRDGQRYGYVELENRYWLTENMRYHVEGSKLNPENPSVLYGRLYNWQQAMQVCPEGWHLSSTYDWMSLERFILGRSDDVLIMGYHRGTNEKIFKSKDGWANPGTDSLRVNILPAGRADLEEFACLGRLAFFWTSSEHILGGLIAERFAEYRALDNDSLGVYSGVHTKKNNYYSCRCTRYIDKYLDD